MLDDKKYLIEIDQIESYYQESVGYLCLMKPGLCGGRVHSGASPANQDLPPQSPLIPDWH
jgi:hypothetical protein